MSYETAVVQWREGERRVGQAPTAHGPALERVVQAIVAELRRRLGGVFTVDELVDLYESGTAWSLDVAHRVAPGAPWAWEERVVTDAAFGRYLREASDFAGGRRLERSRPQG